MGPHLRGRIDLEKFNKGLQRMENFLPTIQGPATFRQGTEWLHTMVDGNIRLIDFSINNENRYLLALFAGAINIYDTTGLLLYSRSELTDGDPIPWLDSEIMDIRFSREVEQMIFTHPNHPPIVLSANTVFESVRLLSTEAVPPDFYLNDVNGTELYAGSTGSAGKEPWALDYVDFTSHPFQKIDTSNNVLRMGVPKEVIRLSSTDDDFSYTPAQITEMATVPYYVEYQVANQWGLGRVLTTTANEEGVSAPSDPSGANCYVDPVESVVNIEDPTVRTVMIEGTLSAPWTEEDRVPAGEFHVRADALVFQTANINSWIRIGGDRLFTQVPRPLADAQYNSQDGLVRWGRVVDYLGVQDHPVDFIAGSPTDALDSGVIYQVYEWGAVTELGVYNANQTSQPSNPSSSTNRTAYCTPASTPRFAMNAWIALQGNPTDATYLTANMATQKQFDVVKVDETNIPVQTDTTLVGTGNLRVTTGTVTVFDLKTDDTGGASHTTTVLASTNTFSNDRDTGRFILGNLVSGWVLLKITSATALTAECDVLSPYPIDDITGELKNDGVFTEFRMGAWYTGNWPVAVTFYEQRRVYAGSKNDPNLVWLSKSNDNTDFRTAEDDGLVLDTTGITYPLGTSSTIIRWVESGPTLIAGTESNEWQLRPNEFSAAITPSNIRITQETGIGSLIQGERIGSSLFFPHISGKQFIEFRYDFQTQQFITSTTTKLVDTIFQSDPIRSFSYQSNPNSVIWLVTEGGRLITLTYRKEDDYYAWAEHPTSGNVREVVVVPKGDATTSEDQVWFIFEHAEGNTLELMSPIATNFGTDPYKLDMAFMDSYSRSPTKGVLETPTSIVSVPPRLIVDGKAHVVVDGLYLGNLPVSAGAAELPDGTVVTKYSMTGFVYDGVLLGNPQAFETQGKNAWGQTKRVVAMRPYVYESLGYSLGTADVDGVLLTTEILPINPDIENLSPSVYTGFMEEEPINDAQFNIDQPPAIVHDKPYPLTIVAYTLKTQVN